MRTLPLAGAALALALGAAPAALLAQNAPPDPVAEQAAEPPPDAAEAPADPVFDAVPPDAPPAPPPRSADEVNARTEDRPPTTAVIDDADPRTPATVVTNDPGNASPPPPDAFGKEYPTCGGEVQDSCRNPGGV